MGDNLFDYYIFKSIHNTNDEIKKINQQENEKKKNLALFALEQKIGRGRAGKIWYSSRGDLTCSFLINYSLEATKIGQVNLLILSNLLNLLEKMYSNIDFKFKWPNDIYLNEKKLAGILVETSLKENATEHITIGIGMNLIASSKKTNFKSISISDFSNQVDSLNCFFRLSRKISDSFKNFNDINFSYLSNYLTQKCKDFKKEIKIKKNKKIFKGVFVKIDDSGSLIFNVDGRLLNISYGEIL